jgi:hypothetical protein
VTKSQDSQFNGTVQAGRREDLAEFGRLYRCAYPHATEKNLQHDIKPAETNSWVTYKNSEGVILIATHLRIDGLVWLLADPAKSDSLEIVHGFLVLLQ